MMDNQLTEPELINLNKFYLTAAVICTLNAVPILGGLINGSLANFLTIAVLVISVMILLKPNVEDVTKIPCILGIISAALNVTGFVIGRSEQYALLGFLSDYTFPIDITSEIIFTQNQLDSLGLVMALGALSIISWGLISVAAALFFINHSRIKKMTPTAI